uniref:Putative LOV domain-containing protein n=1 Tax=Heuchera sanguinea TaxID=43368 RepID=A0A126WY57_HEUSA|nr:putative LOV domain-containing protein [Heuchera sanguinea]
MESSRLGLIEQSWVREALDELPDNFTITDPSISGHPIVFASVGFSKMSGYSRDEVVGKNGRVFQGPGTNRRSVMEIREAVRGERSVQVNLLNYRKDGTPFWMLFHMVPVFGKEDGRVIHFVAVQVPISRKLRRSGSEFCGRNGVDFCDTAVYGSCRREVSSDSAVELSRVLALDSDSRGLEIEEPCEASDAEKRRAATAINNILSVLTHYSELTGKLLCGKRCCLPGTGLLSSSVTSSLGRIKQSFVLTNPHLPDLPIVYASDAFLKLTGYARHEVLGRNCRFLSGVDTDPSTVFKIKEGIRTEQACTVRILSYRKDKTSFWNLLHISPVRNASGKVAYFIGVQLEESCYNQDGECLRPDMRQLSAVGAVKVAVRTMSMSACSSKS